MTPLKSCILVASDAQQAGDIEAQVAARQHAGLYPREISFRVMCDPELGRIGSGGATLRAAIEARPMLDAGEPVLVIHAGGESRRMPAFAPEGKLFAPLPLASSAIFPPVVLDLQLTLFLRFPWRPGELVVSSGDVAIDFDTEVLPQDRGAIYGLAKAESLELGSHHGVFRFDRNRGRVLDYFQKESASYLAEHATLEGSRTCAVDIGIVGFSGPGLESFLSIAEKPLPDRSSVIQQLEAGALQFDLYVEILMACLAGIGYEDYCRKVSRLTRLPPAALKAIHASFEGVQLGAFLTRRTTFLHFGSLSEYPVSSWALASGGQKPFYCSDAAELEPVVTNATLQLNSVNASCSAPAGARFVLLESCSDTRMASTGGGNLLLGLRDRRFAHPIPAGICIDERDIPAGRTLLVYSTNDTWRPVESARDITFCGRSLETWLAERSLSPGDLFTDLGQAGFEYDLWQARLFLPGSDEAFAEGYWNASAAGSQWCSAFLKGPRLSLREVTAQDSLSAREMRRLANRRQLIRGEILGGHGWVSIAERDFRDSFSPADLPELRRLSTATDDDLVRIYRERLLAAVSGSAGGDSISSLRIVYLSAGGAGPLRRCVKPDQIVWARSPVRLDIAGGWTDTPPFTLREGGEVVNIAVDLNDQPPIQVFCRPTEERTIRIHSIDLGVGETLRGFEDLEDFRKPGSPFALPKAALRLLGLTGRGSRGTTLGGCLEEIGCGLELSLLCAVPKGSGLGTSSILGATILGALQRFFGLEVEQNELIRQVLQMEQMLTTGGGWQDQIGGLAGGVKYIVTQPGLRPAPILYQLDPFLFEQFASCFTLYYTGVTRLAKNILQEVVDRVNGMEPAYLFTLRNLKRLARDAREAISRRDLRSLAAILDASWEANKLIHPSTTNEEVEEMLARVQGLYAGMKLLGAGGGGFALFLSDGAEAASRLRERLAAIRHDRARLVDMSINHRGLHVTAS